MGDHVMYDAAQNPHNGLAHEPMSFGPSAAGPPATSPFHRGAEAALSGTDPSPNAGQTQDNAVESAEDDDPKSRSAKRRRLSKDADKKYICPAAGCDKRYSRAEHLYRHQLNHQPKQIYECDYPGCDRRFVRQDLCTRHRERHASRESGQVRTTKSRYDLPVTYQDRTARLYGASAEASEGRRDSTMTISAGDSHDLPKTQPLSHRRKSMKGSRSPMSVRSQQPFPPGPPPAGANTKIDSEANGNGTPQVPHYESTERPRRPTLSMDTGNGYPVTTPPRYGGEYITNNPQHAAMYPMSAYPAYPAYSPHQPQPRRNSTAFTPVYHSTPQSVQYMSPTAGTAPTTHTMTNMTNYNPSYPSQPPTSLHQQSVREPHLMNPPMHGDMFAATMGQSSTAPMAPHMDQNHMHPPQIFSNEIYGNAPFASSDDFAQWLFDSDPNFGNAMMSTDMLNEDFSSNRHTPLDYGAGRMDMQRTSGENSGEQTPAVAPPVKDYQPPRAYESTISHQRRNSLVNFIIDTFHDSQHTLVAQYRATTLEGEHDKYPHVLSLPMLQNYLSSFWNNVHPQLPILHRPTFATETCPDFLLLAILALGSSNLDPSHGFESRQRSSDLSYFLAWHVRFKIYQEADFGPPAKLWIFQTLLLLEIFEKMYSTRALHERAHVHHSTTITLIRRSSTLIGRYSQDFPPYTDPTTTPTGTNGIAYNTTNNTDWDNWINLEATRRIAFAAFIIDTTHAHMFGHSAVMVAHEMRLALPCDEAMWAAESWAEVSAIRVRLEGQEYRQVAFLEALKKTLNGQPVRTNTFGRVSIIAGLLSVAWHMKMQDIRHSMTGVGSKQGSWALQLLHAFDFWKKDFDGSLQTLAALQPRSEKMGNKRLVPAGEREELDRDNVFEARTVLHHLAHMAMHSDVLDCMMLAGAPRLLGRIVTPQEYANARTKVLTAWAPSARARDSTFYALKFLSSALLPDENGGQQPQSMYHNERGGWLYEARDDVLLNRPWVLYTAAMVAWGFGMALEGPLKEPEIVLKLVGDREAQVRDMTAYLSRVSGDATPDTLGAMEGKNRLLGLFMLLRGTFLHARWELLHEAAELMGDCIDKLCPGVKWDERREARKRSNGHGGPEQTC